MEIVQYCRGEQTKTSWVGECTLLWRQGVLSGFLEECPSASPIPSVLTSSSPSNLSLLMWSPRQHLTVTNKVSEVGMGIRHNFPLCIYEYKTSETPHHVQPN